MAHGPLSLPVPYTIVLCKVQGTYVVRFKDEWSLKANL